MLKRIIPYAHDVILNYINKDSICVDMTVGNGNDTLFLAQNCKHVHGFDIQLQAIENTKDLLETNQVSNVTLYQTSHEYIKEYVNECDCIVFNLGYLPSSDKEITTTFDTTYKAIKEGLDVLNKDGIMVITVYPGHTEGAKESRQLLNVLKELPSKYYSVLVYQFINKDKSPYNIFIEKIR
jgi:methylase of polypeptide subunit release factors